MMSDHFTNELFVSEHFKYSAVIFPISRICVDPERFKDDAQEIMSKKGMGVIYTHSHDGLPIRRELTEEERLRLLDEYYYPHHRSLETKIDEALSLNNKCLIIDCHSFPGKPLPCELNQATDRPDICIGADEFHTPQRLVDECVRLFESYHLRTKVNEPFSGTLVPSNYYRSSKNVRSVMIEVNRKLYLNEDSALKSNNFSKIKRIIRMVLESLQKGQ